jgi:Zc3h12a-like Ribonuclease NYN domain/S1 RNA binding domain
MPTRTKQRHVVVDGSNLATEGRSMPSLKQLNEAVLAYMEEHPDDVVTVVVDATFGHRIDPREVAEFDAAVENNELVAPPAGAIGRGDAFVLTIANKVNATVISNDSYQEFHGDYDWLFDEGRLVGGKPVPNVGWVFVPRVPVRGPISRRAVKDAQKAVKAPRAGRTAARASKEASQPMPVPTAPPPGSRSSAKKAKASAAAASPAATAASPVRASAAPRPAKQTDAPTATRPHMVNGLLPFIGFVEQHPVGSTVAAVVESYSSHGAYVTEGDARGYVPLRLMAEPPPRSARSVMKLGDTVELVVVSFNATRRSIDLAVPGMEPPEVKAVMVAPARPVKRSRKKAAVGPAPIAAEPVVAEPVAAGPAKRTRKKAAKPAPTTEAAEPQPSAEPLPRPALPAASEEPVPAGPAKRTRKKAAKAPPAAGAAEPAAASPAPVKRSRKKAAAPVPEAPPPPESPATPVKRTRKKAPAP